jgi:hypothetical protein
LFDLINNGLFNPFMPIRGANRNEEPAERPIYQRITDAYHRFMRNRALKRVERDAYELRKVSFRFQDDEEIVLKAVNQAGCTLIAASERIRGNRDIVRTAIEKWSFAFMKGYRFPTPFECASLELRDDPEICESAFQKDRGSLKFASKNRVLDKVAQNGLNLRFASDAHCNDLEIVTAAFQQNPRAIEYASRECVIQMLQQGIEISAYELSLEQKQDPYILVELVQKKPYLIAHLPVSQELLSNRDFVCDILQRNGLALQYLPLSQDDSEAVDIAFQNNPASFKFASRACVLEKVAQNGLLLEHASSAHRSDPEVCRAAFQNNPYSLAFADVDFVRQQVQQSGLALRYASERDQNDIHIVEVAFQNDPFALQFASESRVLEFLRLNGLNLQYASTEHRANWYVVQTARQQNVNALQFASAEMQNMFSVSSLPSSYILGLGRPFIVKLEEIEEQPLQVLKALYPKMENNFPKIQYDDSPGVDAGGLSRDFVTRLMKRVFDSDKAVLPMTENGGKLMPLMEKGNQDQFVAYQAIGALFAHAFEKRQGIVTGNYFQPLLFQMIHALTNEEIATLSDSIHSEEIPKEIQDKLFRIYAKEELHLPDEQISAILQGNIPEELQSYGYDSRDDFFNASLKQKMLASLVMAKSMRAHLSGPNSWDQVKGAVNEFGLKIEGSLTKESVLTALEWNRDHPTKEHLVQWINNCSSEELEKFVWTLTGSPTLAPGQALKVKLYAHATNLPVYHTCFFSMDLPNGYPSYEIFKQKLEQSLSSVSGMQLQ